MSWAKWMHDYFWYQVLVGDDEPEQPPTVIEIELDLKPTEYVESVEVVERKP